MFEIGNTLREARVRRNLTLQQVEEDIKIRVKYVQAMENEDWDVMPGVTYVKGFLRTYATYLGLDPEVIIGEFRSRAHGAVGGASRAVRGLFRHRQAAQPPRPQHHRHRRRGVPHRPGGDLRAGHA